jgi:hypothetical protein
MCLAITMTGKAQYYGNSIERDLKFKTHLFHFGVELGVNSSGYKIDLDTTFLHRSNIYSVKSKNGAGFTIGIVSDLHLNKYFDLRFIPDLSFAEKDIVYGVYGDSNTTKKVESTYLDFPIHLKYKSKAYKDMKVYCLTGFKYSIDMSSNANARKAENLVKVTPHGVEFDYGLGIEFHLPLVIIAPEIKFSYGLNNVLIRDPKLQYSAVLKNLRLRTTLFTIHFEG